jgi:chromosome segregation ATPase
LKIHREFERHKAHLAELSGRERQLQDYAEELMQVQAKFEQDKRTTQREIEKKTKCLEDLRTKAALKQQEAAEQSDVLQFQETEMAELKDRASKVEQGLGRKQREVKVK